MTETVLVVEDDATLASAVRYNLERNGYACLLAADGGKALELAKRERPALVLLTALLLVLGRCAGSGLVRLVSHRSPLSGSDGGLGGEERLQVDAHVGQ